MERVSILCTALCVGLLVGGCSVRKEYDPSAEELPKKLVDYLADKSTGEVSELFYEGTEFICYKVTSTSYTYNVGEKTLTIGECVYTYVDVEPTEVEIGGLIDNNESEKNYLVGNFNAIPDSAGDNAGKVTSRVQVMVDRDTKDVTVVEARTYIQYFIEETTYGGDYRFHDSVGGGQKCMTLSYISDLYYKDENGVFTEEGVGKGVFTNTYSEKSYKLEATIDPAGNITLGEEEATPI